MSSITFFFIFIPSLALILLAINLIFAPHNPYQEKNSPFECGFTSFAGQNRTQFSISFFIFALLFLLFDLEILLVYPYLVSSYTNETYGLFILLIFLGALTLGFAFELGKKALSIDSKQTQKLNYNTSVTSVIKAKLFYASFKRAKINNSKCFKNRRNIIDNFIVDAATSAASNTAVNPAGLMVLTLGIAIALGGIFYVGIFNPVPVPSSSEPDCDCDLETYRQVKEYIIGKNRTIIDYRMGIWHDWEIDLDPNNQNDGPRHTFTDVQKNEFLTLCNNMVNTLQLYKPNFLICLEKEHHLKSTPSPTAGMSLYDFYIVKYDDLIQCAQSSITFTQQDNYWALALKLIQFSETSNHLTRSFLGPDYPDMLEILLHAGDTDP